MRSVRIALLSVTLLAMSGGAVAQDAVPSLTDLVGIDKGSGGYQMQQRNYKYIRTETRENNDQYDYWQEQENGQCVVVNVWDGRFTSISYAEYEDCRGGGQGGHGGHGDDEYDRRDEFETVCGVIVDGETHRYRCKAVDSYKDGRKVRTGVHYPDMILRMVWKSGNRVELHFEGMTPQQATYRTYEGETDIRFEDKTYFFISDKEAARLEVQHY